MINKTTQNSSFTNIQAHTEPIEAVDVDEEETIHGFIENRTVFGKPSSGCPEQFRIIIGHMFRNIWDRAIMVWKNIVVRSDSKAT